MEVYLSKVRREKGISLSALAEISGVSRSHIYNIETGSKRPTIPAMCKLAAALEVHCNELFDCGEIILGRRV